MTSEKPCSVCRRPFNGEVGSCFRLDCFSQGYARRGAEIEALRAGARPLTYLACPYSHPEWIVREARFRQANRAAVALMAQGHKVFSPISHTHPIAEAGALPLGWDFWEAFDRAYLAHSARVIVLRLVGWDESKGVAAEIAIAREMGIPVEYMDAAQTTKGPDNE